MVIPLASQPAIQCSRAYVLARVIYHKCCSLFMDTKGTNAFNHNEAKDALKWAAYTYVVAALGSLATLVYYIMIFMNRRD